MSFGRLPRSSAAARPMADINMTPLIDVMLVLLVIFLVAAPLLGGALRLELPSSQATAPAATGEPLRLSLDARGQAYWNGEAVGPMALRERLQRLGREQPETELLLALDRSLPYGRVAALIEQLQAAGLSRVAFATAPAGAASALP